MDAIVKIGYQKFACDAQAVQALAAFMAGAVPVEENYDVARHSDVYTREEKPSFEMSVEFKDIKWKQPEAKFENPEFDPKEVPPPAPYTEADLADNDDDLQI